MYFRFYVIHSLNQYKRDKKLIYNYFADKYDRRKHKSSNYIKK